MDKKFIKQIGLQAIVMLLLYFALPSLYVVIRDNFWGRKIHTTWFGQQEAVLYRKNDWPGIKYIMMVNGKKVYVSPRYMDYGDCYYQAWLQWDRNYQIIVFHLRDKNVFAINPITQQVLKKGELQNYQFVKEKETSENYNPIIDIDE